MKRGLADVLASGAGRVLCGRRALRGLCAWVLRGPCQPVCLLSGQELGAGDGIARLDGDAQSDGSGKRRCWRASCLQPGASVCGKGLTRSGNLPQVPSPPSMVHRAQGTWHAEPLSGPVLKQVRVLNCAPQTGRTCRLGAHVALVELPSALPCTMRARSVHAQSTRWCQLARLLFWLASVQH